jgi:phage gp45-like
MAGSRKETLEETHADETTESREVYLRDGRKLVVSEQGGDQLVEVRNAAGLLEVRIKLTDEGPVLQMEAARLQLRASEAVHIESKHVEVKATEQLALAAGRVAVTAEDEVKVEAKGDVDIDGKMIWLN